MIIGIGNDLVDLERIRQILRPPIGERFVQRVLTPCELAYLESRIGAPLYSLASTEEEFRQSRGRIHRAVEFIAGRFAVKEAVVKALGCGIGKEVGFQDMTVLPNALGRPECTLSEAAFQRLQLPSLIRIHVSITHTEQLAAAYVVIENEQ
jgi:holo-[acyl-carrier protein] synthase